MKHLKSFCIVLLCLLGFGVMGCVIGFPIYANHKGYDNTIDWIQDWKIFEDKTAEDEIVEDNLPVEDTENTEQTEDETNTEISDGTESSDTTEQTEE